MKVGSLFSGVGGFDLGLERAGMEIAWQVEIDPQSRSVLRHHWPNAELHKDVNDVGGSHGITDRERVRMDEPDLPDSGSDMGNQPDELHTSDRGRNDVGRTNLAPVDLICGGFPCQDLSVAGKREGMAGQRSGLWWEFHRILGELTPRWCLIENVPGLLSSNEGRDMLALVDSLEQLGYGWSYRILDSQHFGVAQRRRRVFIVGHFGGPCPPEILLESEGVSWDSEEGEAQGEGAAESSGRGTDGEGSRGLSFGFDPGQSSNPKATEQITAEGSPPLPAGQGAAGRIAVLAHGQANHEAPIVFHKAQKAHDPDDHERWEESEVSGTLNGQGDTAGMVALNEITFRGGAQQDEFVGHSDVTGSLAHSSNTHGGNHQPKVFVQPETYHDLAPSLVSDAAGMSRVGGQAAEPQSVVGAVPRRLTPTEGERLQGIPDGWTGIDGMADGPRYRMMGNAVTVNVAEYVGKRIIGQEKG